MSNARFSILQARAVKDKRISDSQFRTLAALGMYADEAGWCFPALSTLGKDLSKSKQAVGRDTIALKKLGYLEVKPRFDDKGSRRSSLYRLKYDLPPVNMDDSTPSTLEVDTPSTPEVDVNDPVNEPIEIDKVSEWLKMGQFKGAKKEIRVDAILSYLGQTLRRTTTSREWLDFAKHIDTMQQKNGWKVETFVAWLLGQKGYDPQYWSVKKMLEFYPSAFAGNSNLTEAPKVRIVK